MLGEATYQTLRVWLNHRTGHSLKNVDSDYGRALHVGNSTSSWEVFIVKQNYTIMGRFITENRNWTEYRELPGEVMEVDIAHRSYDDKYMSLAYYEKIDFWHSLTLNSLKKAQEVSADWLLIAHGHSTSRIGQQTARSTVRKLMRSKEATPYIIRSKSIQHLSVFVAAIRKKR